MVDGKKKKSEVEYEIPKKKKRRKEEEKIGERRGPGIREGRKEMLDMFVHIKASHW